MWRCLVSMTSASLLSLALLTVTLLLRQGLVVVMQILHPDQVLEDSIYFSTLLINLLEAATIIFIYLHMRKRKQMSVGPSKKHGSYLLVFFLIGFTATFLLSKYPTAVYRYMSPYLYDELLAIDHVVDLILMHMLGFLAILSAIVMSRHYPDRS